MRSIPAIIALALCMLASLAAADWPAGGGKIGEVEAQRGFTSTVFSDLASGDLSVIGLALDGTSHPHLVQRVIRSGGVAPGWPAQGRQLTSLSGSNAERSFFVDADGFAWHTFRINPNFTAQYVDSSGVLMPTAPPNYFTLGSSTGYYSFHGAPIPGGDIFLAKGGSSVIRVTRTGTIVGTRALPGWSIDDGTLLPDGSGGAIVFMRSNASTLLPIATRVDGDLTLHAGWPAAGLALRPLANSNINYDSVLLSSGSAHALACWWDGPTVSDYPLGTVFLQRFDFDGALDPTWPANALQPIGADTLGGLTVLTDGAGGAYVLHQRRKNGPPLATHVSADGNIVGAANTIVLDPGAQYVQTEGWWSLEPERLVADAAPDGGLFVGYGDARLSPAVSFRVRRLLPDLTNHPAWPDTGLVVLPTSPGTFNSSLVGVHSDGSGGAFVAWGGRPAPFYSDLWMTHVAAPTQPAPASGPLPLAAASLLLACAGILILRARWRYAGGD